MEWQDSPVFGRYMVTKYYVSCFEFDPFSNTNQLYCSVADDYMWFDRWPGVVRLPHHERPLKLNFGDDEVYMKFMGYVRKILLFLEKNQTSTYLFYPTSKNRTSRIALPLKIHKVRFS